MPEAPVVDPDAPEGDAPVADPPVPVPGTTARKLDALLADLDDDAKAAVLGEVAKARKEAAGYRARTKELEPLAAQAQALLDAQKTAEQLATEKALDAELRAHGYRDRAVAAEVKALAANDFADPADAAHFLELKDFVDDDGEIDTAAIASSLDALLKAKPHLGKPDETPRLRPDRSQGSTSRGAPAAPENEFAAFIQNQLQNR